MYTFPLLRLYDDLLFLNLGLNPTYPLLLPLQRPISFHLPLYISHPFIHLISSIALPLQLLHLDSSNC